MTEETTPKVAGVFSMIVATIVALILIFSSKEYGIANLLIPLFFLVLGLWLILSKKKGEVVDEQGKH